MFQLQHFINGNWRHHSIYSHSASAKAAYCYALGVAPGLDMWDEHQPKATPATAQLAMNWRIVCPPGWDGSMEMPIVKAQGRDYITRRNVGE